MRESVRVFGQSTPALLASFDPDTSWWRTSQLSLLEDLGECLETWPRSGMTRSGIAYRLQPLVPLTAGTVSGSLPTPVARDDGKTPKAHMAMKRRMKGGERKTITSLSVLARNNFRQANGELVWPTPTARDHKDTGDLSKVPPNGLLPRVVWRRERESHEWSVEPKVGRMADGIPSRVDRLKALGNALVPQIAEWIGCRIQEWEEK